MEVSIDDLIRAVSASLDKDEVLCFTQEVWDYIDEHCPDLVNGVRRVILPNKVENLDV